MNVITYPCWDRSWYILAKRAQERHWLGIFPNKFYAGWSHQREHGETSGEVIYNQSQVALQWHVWLYSLRILESREIALYPTRFTVSISTISTRWVDGTPTTEVTPVTSWKIHTPDLSHQMVTVMVMNDLLPHLLCNVNRPSHSEIQLFQNLTMKIHGQGHVCGQRSRSCLTIKFQRSRLWSRSNPLVTSEAWSSIDMFAFRFVAIGPLLAEI